MNYFTELDTILASTIEKITVNDIILAYKHDPNFAISLFFKYNFGDIIIGQQYDNYLPSIKEFFCYFANNYNELGEYLELKSRRNSVEFKYRGLDFRIKLKNILGSNYFIAGFFVLDTCTFDTVEITNSKKTGEILRSIDTRNSSQFGQNEFIPSLKNAIEFIKQKTNAVNTDTLNKFKAYKNTRLDEDISVEDQIKYINMANDLYDKSLKNSIFDIKCTNHNLQIYKVGTRYIYFKYHASYKCITQCISLEIKLTENIYELDIFFLSNRQKFSTGSYDELVNYLKEYFQRFKNNGARY